MQIHNPALFTIKSASNAWYCFSLELFSDKQQHVDLKIGHLDFLCLKPWASGHANNWIQMPTPKPKSALGLHDILWNVWNSNARSRETSERNFSDIS